MELLVEKYAQKLRRARLCEAPLVGGMDDEPAWNKDADPALAAEFSRMFVLLNIAGFVLGRPAEPFATIMDFLAQEHPEGFAPRDTETRTFLHEIPVAHEATPEAVARALGSRKGVIVRGPDGCMVAAHGSMTPEQPFVTFSSVCFSCFVLFFADYLRLAREGRVSPARQAAFERAVSLLPEPIETPPKLASGPFQDADSALSVMAEAGLATVEYGLVDSYFGNISALVGETIWISQTGSSLDELPGLIDPCPLDGSSTACLTASSELTAHAGIYALNTEPAPRTILHGHPRFTVILTMDCEQGGKNATCEVGRRGQCHLRCAERRLLPTGAPIVPGEVGTGPTGLSNTLPPAIGETGAAAVWGHGLFAMGSADFNAPFAALLETENRSRERYFEMIREALGG